MADSEQPQGWQAIGTPDDPANEVRAQAIAAIERGDPFILLSFDRTTGATKAWGTHVDKALRIGMLEAELQASRVWYDMHLRAIFTDHAAEDAAMFERAKRVAEVMAEQVRQHCPVCAQGGEAKLAIEPMSPQAQEAEA